MRTTCDGRGLMRGESPPTDTRIAGPGILVDGAEGRVSEAAAEARRILVEEARRAVARICGSAARALVLTGSFARGEASVLPRAGDLIVLGDVEFLLVLKKGVHLSAQAELVARREIETAALHRGVHCPVDVAMVHAGFFRSLPPHVFSFELRACGEVVWGDRSVLALIPPLTANGLDREDAWRLLGNRIVEQLGAMEDVSRPESEPPLRMQCHTIKLFLDMATSLLVFTGDYAPTYRQRADRLFRLASRTSRRMPFPLEKFASRVSDCTRWKLQPEEVPRLGWEFAQEARAYARHLWLWELQQLTGLGDAVGERILMRRWMKAQSYRARVRGWLSAGRRLGGFKEWRRWPRFLRLAARCSPRYLVYAAAVDLFFSPAWMAPGSEGPRSSRVVGARELPLARWRGDERTTTLAAEIVRNYRQLLVGTRA